jgi:hypothetical protein
MLAPPGVTYIFVGALGATYTCYIHSNTIFRFSGIQFFYATSSIRVIHRELRGKSRQLTGYSNGDSIISRNFITKSACPSGASAVPDFKSSPDAVRRFQMQYCVNIRKGM